jgi:enterochelin esterase-like enzyme
MMTRQAKLIFPWLLLLFGLFACTPSRPADSTPSPTPPLPTRTPSPVPPTRTATLTPTATLLACLSQPGRVEESLLESTKPPQQFLVYLPPCYDQQTDLRYPVLYLLHGQTFTDDQWVRLGAVRIADGLIHSGEAAPFLIVFPDDRYWNLPPGPLFGERLVNALIPHIDGSYRTLADREHRALGGLSRGGGWAVNLGLTHPDLFGMLGLHSPAIFTSDNGLLADWIEAIPSSRYPRVWLDIGDQDRELGYARLFTGILAQYGVPLEFHVYSGDHSETYWGRHVEEYLRWYTQGWSESEP